MLHKDSKNINPGNSLRLVLMLLHTIFPCFFMQRSSGILHSLEDALRITFTCPTYFFYFGPATEHTHCNPSSIILLVKLDFLVTLQSCKVSFALTYSASCSTYSLPNLTIQDPCNTYSTSTFHRKQSYFPFKFSSVILHQLHFSLSEHYSQQSWVHML